MFDLGTIHVLLLTGAAVTTAVLSGYAWGHREQPGAVPFVGAMVGLTVWSTIEVLALTETGASHLVWERVQWTAIAVVPLLFFLFIADFTGYGSVLSPRVVPFIYVVPAVSAVLAWTNPAHHLMWTNPEHLATGGVVTLSQQFGPWFWVYFAYAYTLLLVGFVLLLRLVVVSDYLYFDQSVLVVIGILAPLIGNALSVFELAPIPGLDLTAYGFTITGVAFGNAIFRYRLFDLLPATRQLGKQTALAALDDGVVIVGEDMEILYLNEAAVDIFDCEPASRFGDPLDTLLSTDQLDFTSEDALAELPIADRTFEVTTAPITDQHDRHIGHTILFHDVTSRDRRERRLREHRDELARLEQLNRVIRSVNSALVGATTRDEIAHAVCETLASDGPYDAVWLSTGVTTDSDFVGMTDGDDTTRRLDSADELPDQVLLSTGDAEGTELAVAGDPSPASRADGGGWVTVPLSYGRTVYGTLALRSSREAGFVERELDALGELGETVGYAIHAVEQRQLLVADSAIKLKFRSTDPGAFLVELSEQVGPSSLDGLVPGEAGALLAYVTVEDTTAEEVKDVVADEAGISEVRQIDENGSTTVEVVLTDESLCCPLVEYGANVRSAEATGGECQFVAEVSPETDVREVVQRVTDAYPATELTSKRDLSPTDGTSTLPEERLDDLTERQREVLEAAYRAGYFDWPRDSTAEDVADSLDITSPTLHSHLRKAENRLLSEFFEEE